MQAVLGLVGLIFIIWAFLTYREAFLELLIVGTILLIVWAVPTKKAPTNLQPVIYGEYHADQ